MAADIYIPQVVVEAFGQVNAELIIPQVVVEVFGNTQARFTHVGSGGITLAGSATASTPTTTKTMASGVQTGPGTTGYTYTPPITRTMASGAQLGPDTGYTYIAPITRTMAVGVKCSGKSKQLQKTVTVKARQTQVNNFPLMIAFDYLPTDATFRDSTGKEIPSIVSASRAIVKVDLKTTSQNIGVYYAD